MHLGITLFCEQQCTVTDKVKQNKYWCKRMTLLRDAFLDALKETNIFIILYIITIIIIIIFSRQL